VDDESWAIHRLVVETGHGLSGKEVLISPSQIDRISFEKSKVFVKLTNDVVTVEMAYRVNSHTQTER
jgi:hypothetical protein